MTTPEFASPKNFINLRRFNNILSVFIIFIAMYIGLSPFWPQISWWIKRDAPIVSSQPQTQVIPETIPAENTLVVPRLELSEKILEGESTYTVDKGVWRRPQTSQPPKESNTVLVGHRFTYQGNAVFYHLDKIQMNDNIIVYWEGKKYVYRVNSIKTVPPSVVSVEAPSDKAILTLYTCTPLVTAENRLVVTAELTGDKL